MSVGIVLSVLYPCGSLDKRYRQNSKFKPIVPIIRKFEREAILSIIKPTMALQWLRKAKPIENFLSGV